MLADAGSIFSVFGNDAACGGGDMMYDIEHPDVTAIQRYGYPCWQEDENKDCPENRARYIEEYQNELVEWLRTGYPEILDEFLEYAPGYGCTKYKDWLN